MNKLTTFVLGRKWNVWKTWSGWSFGFSDWVPKLDFEFCNAWMWSWLSGEDVQMTLSLVSRDIGNSVALLRIRIPISEVCLGWAGNWERQEQIFQHIAFITLGFSLNKYFRITCLIWWKQESQILGFWYLVLFAHFTTSLHSLHLKVNGHPSQVEVLKE